MGNKTAGWDVRSSYEEVSRGINQVFRAVLCRLYIYLLRVRRRKTKRGVEDNVDETILVVSSYLPIHGQL